MRGLESCRDDSTRQSTDKILVSVWLGTYTVHVCVCVCVCVRMCVCVCGVHMPAHMCMCKWPTSSVVKSRYGVGSLCAHLNTVVKRSCVSRPGGRVSLKRPLGSQ